MRRPLQTRDRQRRRQGTRQQTARTWTVSASVPLFLPEAFHLSGNWACDSPIVQSHALVLLPVTNTPPPVTA
jgi:hypothetical protein